MRRYAAFLAFIVIVFVGCDPALVGPAVGDDPSTVDPGSSPDQETPFEEQINDVLRDESFSYSTLVPVRFSFSLGSSTTTSSRSTGTSSTPIVVRVTDPNDQVLFAATGLEGETVEGEALVPVEEESLTVTIDSITHETRTFTISEPYQYEEINRSLAVAPSNAPEPDTDVDNDGVADIYDAEPDDPMIAFSRTIPAYGWLTIAFEDNYPALGDGDFNDFVAEYRIIEYRSSDNRLSVIDGTARALARGAGFDHEFGLVVDFAGTARRLTVERFDGEQIAVGEPEVIDFPEGEMRIVLFESTKAAFTREGGVTMDNIDPTKAPSLGYSTEFRLEYRPFRGGGSANVWMPYDPYLIARNTSAEPPLPGDPDIHLIGKLPIEGSWIDPSEDYRSDDPDNPHPWAILVPNDWLWPQEREPISSAYPEFDLWVASLGASHTDWYLSPDPDFVVPRPEP